MHGRSLNQLSHTIQSRFFEFSVSSDLIPLLPALPMALYNPFFHPTGSSLNGILSDDPLSTIYINTLLSWASPFSIYPPCFISLPNISHAWHRDYLVICLFVACLSHQSSMSEGFYPFCSLLCPQCWSTAGSQTEKQMEGTRNVSLFSPALAGISSH